MNLQIFYVSLILTTTPFVSTEHPPYNHRGFRPSQPDPIRTQIPAKQYGPPKPEYGVPSKPDDTVEPTTQPNNIRGVPSKFNTLNFPNVGPLQSLPFVDSNRQQFAFPTNQQTNAQQFNQYNGNLYQQQLPEFGNKLFKPKQSLNFPNERDKLQKQQLPYTVNSYVFNEHNDNFFQNQRSPSSSFNTRSPNVLVQQSKQLPLNEFDNRSPPVKNENKDFNFNNQNSINVQTSILPGLISVPQQKPARKSVDLVQNQNQFANREPQAEIFRDQFSTDSLFGAKRASSPRRGGKVTSAPIRQYLAPATTTERITTSKPRRRRPTTTERDETEAVPVTRRPNVSIANAFAGRLFLLRPDGRLEPVILKRANPHGSDALDSETISTAELTQPLFNSVPLLTF
ncbi:hypothetical protein WA026_015089 [Henosepilachna vigintioctopunctata]|uniref:Uncharacterized protein n=1 Tax=Henosepilachna vigintioctopunctata TaxID=420089 RepID=A0AAW1UAB4_9CUCU